jgi:DNA transposase THAP9
MKITLKRAMQSSSGASGTPNRKRLREKARVLKKQIRTQKRRINTLQQRNSRIKKKIASMKEVLNDLKNKNLINEEIFTTLRSIPGPNEEILKRQIAKIKKEPAPRQYSPELRKFALNLHFFSPAAYSYVRKVYNSALPHPETIASWYRTMEANPGFTDESFKMLALKVKHNQEKPLYCNLAIDEMGIRKAECYDPSTKKMFGRVSVPGTDEDLNLELASNAFVFLLVSVEENWKLPVGYFLINSITAQQKASLVEICIKKIMSVGIKVLGLTFDGLAANLAMSNLLGCSIDTRNLDAMRPYFLVGDQPISVFYDAVHMVKLVRNTFGDYKILRDCDNEIIDWKYITLLHNLQEKEHMFLENKLGTKHVNFKHHKMRVKLATQLLSKSVADSLEFCRDQLKLSSFADCGATVRFLRMFNDVFDLLNSRTMRATGFKKPLNTENIVEGLKLMDNAIEYISQLTHSDKGKKKLLLDSGRKTGFLGSIVCLKSTKFLFDNFIKTGKLQNLKLYRFSQDHIEMFFGAIRAKGGFNNNPNAMQFKGAYRRILIHLDTDSILKSGNCIPLESLEILNVSSWNKPVKKINNENDTENSCEASLDLTYPEIIAKLEMSEMSEFANQIVIYIAGKVVQKLVNCIQCQQCRDYLVQPCIQSSFVAFKRQEIFPSEDVIKLCNITERMFRYFSDEPKNAFKKIENAVFEYFVGIDLFGVNASHDYNDNDDLNNHKILLMKSVVNDYLDVKFHFKSKKTAQQPNVRNFRQRLTIHEGF